MLLTRTITVAAALSLVVAVPAISLVVSNQYLRQQVAERQQVINQGLALSQVNARLINSLAALAARDNDDQIRAVLAQQGITFQWKPGPQAPVDASSKQQTLKLAK